LEPIHLEMTVTAESKDDGDVEQGASGRALPEEAEPEVTSGQTDGEPEQLRLFEDDEVVDEGAEAEAPSTSSGDSEVEDGN
jgi:hypothetical protein